MGKENKTYTCPQRRDLIPKAQRSIKSMQKVKQITKHSINSNKINSMQQNYLYT